MANLIIEHIDYVSVCVLSKIYDQMEVQIIVIVVHLEANNHYFISDILKPRWMSKLWQFCVDNMDRTDYITLCTCTWVP